MTLNILNSYLGNKSTEDQRPDTGNPDDETVVDEQQGNGMPTSLRHLRKAPQVVREFY